MSLSIDPRITHPTKHRIVAAGLEEVADSPTTVTSDNITDASVIGREILTAQGAESVRTIIAAAPDTAATTSEFGLMSPSDKTKLDGIQSGATANQSDSYLLDRANHTGTQAISTVSGLQSALDNKVDKVAGMGLSQENYTTAEKNKLALLGEPHFKGLFPDLPSLEAAVPNPVPGDHAQVVSANPGDPSVTYVWDDPLGEWVVQGLEVSASQVKSLYESNPDTNAFTDAEKSKLAGIAVGATANTGTVTSVGVSVPTGLSVSNSPVTTNGTIAISYSSGYSIPTNTKQGQWDQAYGWGNHATAGYALTSSLSTIATTGQWGDIVGKPAVIAAGETQADARAAIGAGTSDLEIGTTSSTAKAGDWQPTTASKSQTLNGTANAFVSGAAYHNIISWTSLGSVSSGTLAIDLDTSLNFTVSVGGNITVGNPTNADPGKCGEIVITMTSNGSVSWAANWKFLNDVPDIGDNGDKWVVSYKVLDASNVLASASKLAS